jgi:hypothetical protein
VTDAEAATEPGIEEAQAREAARAKLFGGSAGPIRIGRHVIVERIGAGGMGVVFAA